jgi:hypothetical protein
MIKLDDTTYVKPELIAEVSLSEHRDYIIIELESGKKYKKPADYNSNIYDTQVKFITLVNESLKR